MGTPTDDVIARMLAEWRAARPDLDPAPLAVVGRVIVLARHLEKSVSDALAAHELTLGEFDILATLRRHDGGLNPTALCRNVALSSGGMTNRIDRLEAKKLVARSRDPDDRRGIVVRLTPKGLKLIDAATATRFAEAGTSLPPLDAKETAALAGYLARWLARYG